MKVRNGFVSNSSSTSFVCIGMKIDSDVIDNADKLFKEYDLDNDEGCYELLEKICHKTGLQYQSGDNDIYIGRVVSFSDSYEDPEEIEFDLNSAKAKSLKTLCDDFGIEFDVRTYAGTVSS